MQIIKQLIRSRAFHRPRHSFNSLDSNQQRLVRELNRKIDQGEVLFEEAACLCSGIEFNLIASVDRYGVKQQTVICTRCGLVQSNPRMSKIEYARFYSTDLYRNIYEGKDYLSASKNRYNIETGKYIYEAIRQAKSIDRGTQVLEIGAGGGWNLIPFQRAGAKVLGLDYSPTLVNLGIANGISMREGDVGTLSEKFDIIILCHVYEHFLDPISELKQIKKYLKIGGVVYMEIPNILNFSMGQLQSAHTYYFSPKTFHRCVKCCGLKTLLSGSARDIHYFEILGIETKEMDSWNEDNAAAYAEILHAINREKNRQMMRSILDSMGLLGVARLCRAGLRGNFI